jgi:RND family efflux transporter MFP subunit
MEEATLGIGRAQASSDAASAADDFTRIAAPFDGVVTEKLVDPGNTATPGMPLLRVEDTRGFRLEVRVDESRVGQVSPGAKVDVILDSGAIVTGTVSEVARAVQADARAFLVKVALPATEGLRSGMFGRARFQGPVRQVLTVPAEAIVRRGQLASVFVLDGKTARLRLVNVTGTEVLAGLSPGETVIVNPPPTLADGHPVRAGGL